VAPPRSPYFGARNHAKITSVENHELKSPHPSRQSTLSPPHRILPFAATRQTGPLLRPFPKLVLKAAASGEIKLVSVRQRNALRGVRLVVYDSVADYIRRSSMGAGPPVNCEPANGK
jgi:hypothetical protein